MRTLATGFRLRGSAVIAGILVAAVAATSTEAQSSGRERRLDGSSSARFETSVAMLQNELSARRRENFNVALAMIWITRTASSGDLDGDGSLDVDDIQLLEADATDLLTEIRRGNLVSAIEERDANGSDYAAADFFTQLDGLGYDEVLSLAGRPSYETYLEASRRAGSEGACRSLGSPIASRTPSSVFAACFRTIDADTRKALDASIQALYDGKPAEARVALATLDFDALNAYERSTTERILASITNAEGNPAAAREHLLNALAARGLSADETRAVLEDIASIDSRPTANPE
jgi:hypothetical protein